MRGSHSLQLSLGWSRLVLRGVDQIDQWSSRGIQRVPFVVVVRRELEIIWLWRTRWMTCFTRRVFDDAPVIGLPIIYQFSMLTSAL